MHLALLLVMMVLASVTTFRANRRWYVPVALAWTVAFLAFGSWAGLTRVDMAATNWVHGFVWGAAAIGIVTVGMALGVAIPRLHPLFADERIMGSSGARVAHKSLIEVPLGTVLLEEIVFRSVLLGLLTNLYGTVVGVIGSAFLFGLWHILPALEMHGARSMTNGLGDGWWAKLGTVLVTILATGAAGVLFAMLVVWSGSILAPMGLHWATNGPGSIAAWLVGRRHARARRTG
ncbi:MAG: CPBP family intramembrane glutamic endopeptidase [Candidatus Nanopelagicales bacterium]